MYVDEVLNEYLGILSMGERYPFPFALCSGVIQILHDFINKYINSAF